MAPFDVYFKAIADYVADLRNSRKPFRETICAASGGNYFRDLPVRVGRAAQPGIILKEDTGVELGNPRVGSCAFMLWTDRPSLITDNRITLIGPDIQESSGSSLPFGQVLMIAGSSLKEDRHADLEWSQYISDRIEGYMIRSIPRRMWGRVSKAALQKGFSFAVLGKALIGLIKSESPLVEAVEILFVTSGKEDIEGLEKISQPVERIASNIKMGKFIVGENGDYTCTSRLDCRICLDKEVCDVIREQIAILKANIAIGEDGST
jgi:CO dehydrogenase/acetyl-CoA synthase beta subunit